MNLLDGLIVVAVLLGAFGGYRMGFIARALSWAGLGVALVLAVRLLPDLMATLADTTPRGRLLGLLGFLFGLGLLGLALGLSIGTLIHGALHLSGRAEQGDRVLGAVVGGVGVLVFVWLLLPALTSATGWPAREAQASRIVAAIEDVTPAPPASVRELGRMVSEAPFPEVIGPDAGAPPTGALPAGVEARVARSVVKVEGQACSQIQDGTGVVVAPNVVVTNAHVVAGERRTAVIVDGESRDARVVRFDPRRDLAVLRVDDLDLPALTIDDAPPGTLGAVFGHPGGGALRAAPARIAEEIRARGTDIYRTTQTERSVFVLAASLAPGDSGGPLVDRTGDVVGVAFAIDPGKTATAYALTSAEVRPVLAGLPARRADTGSCLIG